MAKFYVIAMMVFLLSLAVAIINQVDIMNQDQFYGYGSYDSEWLGTIQSEAYRDQSFEGSPVQNDQQSDFNSLTELRIAMSILGKSLWNATFGFKSMLESFGLPTVLAVLFALPVWLIYFVFIIQLILRFGWEGTR